MKSKEKIKTPDIDFQDTVDGMKAVNEELKTILEQTNKNLKKEGFKTVDPKDVGL